MAAVPNKGWMDANTFLVGAGWVAWLVGVPRQLQPLKSAQVIPHTGAASPHCTKHVSHKNRRIQRWKIYKFSDIKICKNTNMNIYRYTNLGTNIQWIICEEGCGQNNCFDNLVVSSDWLFTSLSKSVLVKLKTLPQAKRRQTSSMASGDAKNISQ